METVCESYIHAESYFLTENVEKKRKMKEIRRHGIDRAYKPCYNPEKGGGSVLKIFHRLGELNFRQLMDVYLEDNVENGKAFYPDLPPDRQIEEAEQSFYQYLAMDFFRQKDAFCAVWEVQGRYVSALRLEPYRDGMLLEALSTAPEYRRRGFAAALIRAVLQGLPSGKIYSHVGKDNAPSLRTHGFCGFRRIRENAVYIDGSVNDRCCTMMYENGVQ